MDNDQILLKMLRQFNGNLNAGVELMQDLLQELL